MQNNGQRVIWQDGSYTLHELTEAADLRAIGLELAFDSIAGRFIHSLKQRGMDPDSPEALQFLDSWNCVKMGWMRYFVIRQYDKPAVLIEYQPLRQRVSHIRAHGYEMIQPGHPHWRSVCAAVTALKREMPIGLVYDLPQVFRSVITPEGNYEKPTPSNITTAITAQICDLRDRGLLPDALQMPHVTISIWAQAMIEDLGPTGAIKASLFARHDIDYLKLRHCQNITTVFAERISLPNLESAGDLVFRSAREVNAPKLRTAGMRHYALAEVVNVPPLEKPQFDGWPGTYTPFPLTQDLWPTWANLGRMLQIDEMRMRDPDALIADGLIDGIAPPWLAEVVTAARRQAAED